MKKLLLLPILLLSLISTSCWGVSRLDLVEREGLYYKKHTDIPFTGEVTGVWKGRFENGKFEGNWEKYFPRSYGAYDLDNAGSYKNGKKEGDWVYYHNNGQLYAKGSYKNGEHEGDWVYYHNNGRLSMKGSYKNGEYEGEWVNYYENGQVIAKGRYKNGKMEGEWFFYNEDGTVD